MPESLLGMTAVVAWTTFHIAVAIILGGFVSGLVSLGFLQVYARERIQRVVLYRFFERPAPEAGFWRSGLMMFGFVERGANAKTAAYIVGMPERALCRLYYRQISGQFLAELNAEAAQDGKRSQPTPFLDHMRKGLKKGPTATHEIDYAGRQIDVLQAQLGDAVTKSAMSAMTMIWGLFFLAVGIMASADRYDVLRSAGELGPGVLAWLGFWVPYLAMAVAAALVLGICAAACGLVALNALDRITAAK